MTRRSSRLFLFQMVFMDTTATIPTGAAAERWKFSAFMLYGCCIGTIMYPVFGNWVWGGGWLLAARRQLRPRPRPRGLRRFLGRAHAGRRDRLDRLPGSSGRASASTTRTAIGQPHPAAQHPDGDARHASSWPSAGSGSTPAPPWPAPTCASRSSRSTPCWLPPGAPWPPCSGSGWCAATSPTRA